ncbi:hypothetical protein GWK47_023285 [Chionoecetes opilio]|uniref:Uncharacterized protein n=1 Tax=Chionoecetes opilio TaxID=41210 RepID=A0A8J4XMK9_CHIOP|nr:hypothetical protein GWK47_023285 [Chionoecetes opilio]
MRGADTFLNPPVFSLVQLRENGGTSRHQDRSYSLLSDDCRPSQFLPSASAQGNPALSRMPNATSDLHSTIRHSPHTYSQAFHTVSPEQHTPLLGLRNYDTRAPSVSNIRGTPIDSPRN